MYIISLPLFCSSLPLSFVSYSLPPLSSFPCLAFSSTLISLSFKPATVSSVFCFFSFPQSPLSSPGMCHLCGPLLPLYIILFIQSGRCSMLWDFVLPWLSFLLCFLPWSSYIHSLYEYIASFLCSFYLFFFFSCNLLFPLSVYAPSHVT